jgi:hypothetical protein
MGDESVELAEILLGPKDLGNGSPATAALLARGVLSTSPGSEEYRIGELISMLFATACAFCRSPFDGDDCTNSGEGIGFADVVACRAALGVPDGRAGVAD